MRIKHWQGYGVVNAVKIADIKCKDVYSTPYRKLVIKVSGNHEWGLQNNDTYDVYNWLVKRFAKNVPSYTNIRLKSLEGGYEKVNVDGHIVDQEVCVYTIYIRQ